MVWLAVLVASRYLQGPGTKQVSTQLSTLWRSGQTGRHGLRKNIVPVALS